MKLLPILALVSLAAAHPLAAAEERALAPIERNTDDLATRADVHNVESRAVVAGDIAQLEAKCNYYRQKYIRLLQAGDPANAKVVLEKLYYYEAKLGRFQQRFQEEQDKAAAVWGTIG